MDRINVEQLLNRVNWNAILERVDVNHHLNRIDMDHLLDRVDINRIIERSNLEEIVSRATGGFFSEFVEMIRTRIAWIDQWGQRFCRLRCFVRNPYLPPRPGRPQDDETVWPKTLGLRARDFGTAVQFRTCGGISRLAASTIDLFFLALTFKVWVQLVEWSARLFTDDPSWTLDTELQWLVTLIYVFYSLGYQLCMLGCFSRTIGMWCLGTLMVSHNGHRIQFLQIFVHSISMPLNLPFFGWVLVSCIYIQCRKRQLTATHRRSTILPSNTNTTRHFYVETAKCGMNSLRALSTYMLGRSKLGKHTTQTLP